jgi:histidinol-phosphate aminotransferase
MNLEALVRPNIWSLQPYSSARSEFKGSAEVFLDANENPFETGLNRYPDPLQWKLKEKIAAIKQVPKEQIFLGNGSDEAIDLLLRIFCEPGVDHIVTLPPTYGMYRVSADICNVSVKEIPLTRNFQPDVDAILSVKHPNAKVLFLCSPNNPTGNNFDLDAMKTIMSEFEGIVVVDEAYIDFTEQLSCTQLLEEFPNLVVLQTFSKAWGLAGIRLGMAFASKEIIGLFNKVKPPYNINQLTQNAALEALNNASQYETWLAAILEQRNCLQTELSKLDFVQHIYPTDANFLLIRVDDPDDLYQYLVKQKIIVRNRSKVLLCDGCLRITVGKPEEDQRLMNQLAAYPSTVLN